MRDTFTPDSDAVYLAQGAVPPHDNVVTERISAQSRFWYSQGSRNARRRSPDCASSWHEEGELLFSSEKKYQKIPGYRDGYRVTGCNRNDWAVAFSPSAEHSEALYKTWPSGRGGCRARCRAAHQDGGTAGPICGNPVCIRVQPLTSENTPTEPPPGVNKPPFFQQQDAAFASTGGEKIRSSVMETMKYT